jgi:hypothetical protein
MAITALSNSLIGPIVCSIDLSIRLVALLCPASRRLIAGSASNPTG